MFKPMLWALLAALIAAPLAAQETKPKNPNEPGAEDEKPAEPGVKVGDNAPESIDVPNWINTPAFTSFAELKGDVVMIKSWGIN